MKFILIVFLCIKSLVVISQNKINMFEDGLRLQLSAEGKNKLKLKVKNISHSDYIIGDTLLNLVTLHERLGEVLYTFRIGEYSYLEIFESNFFFLPPGGKKIFSLRTPKDKSGRIVLQFVYTKCNREDSCGMKLPSRIKGKTSILFPDGVSVLFVLDSKTGNVEVLSESLY